MFNLMKKSEPEEVTDIVAKEDAAKFTIKDLTSENELVSNLTIDQIFQILKSSVKSTNHEALANMIGCCIDLRDNLEITGQSDLLYTMKKRLETIGEEYKAIQNGFQYYLYQKDVNTIISKVNDDRGFRYLALDNIKNYHRLIPPEALSVVKLAKETFSELLVLHCDPKGVHLAQKTQTQKDRDPILFGRITSTSEKLYLITSWADNLCDYTLEELLDDMSARMTGEEYAIKIDNIPETIDELVAQLNESCGIWHANYIKYDDTMPNQTRITSSSSMYSEMIIFNSGTVTSSR